MSLLGSLVVMFRNITKHPLVQAQSARIIDLVAQLGEAWRRVDELQVLLAAKDRFWLDYVREIQDQVNATSLDQLRGYHPTAAMEARVPEPVRKLFRHDPTGMIVDEVDPRDYDEA